VKRRGNGKSNHYKSGKETLPVKKLYQSKDNTPGGKETLPEAVKELYPNQTDLLNQTKERGARNKPFVKPSAKEVEDYAASIQFPLDGKCFVDYYEARGWKYKGGVAMKDWQAAVRNWKNREDKSGGAKLPRITTEVKNEKYQTIPV
jgi:hypothetical protein